MIKKIKDFFSTRSVVATGNLTDYDDFWYGIGGFETSSGAVVSTTSAMRQWAVYACITEISETLAQLPLKLKRPDGKGGTEDAVDHSLYSLCKDRPNRQMTSFNFRESQQANILTTGNCYAHFKRGRGVLKEITGIWPLDPTATTVRSASNREITSWRMPSWDRIVYEVQTEQGKKVYRSDEILHIVGFGFNGLVGESVLTNFAKESIGNAISLDKFQGAGMKNGVYPSGVLEHPDTLGDNADKFMAALKARYAGTSNARHPMVLENGMKWSKADVSFVDKQFIEQMRMTANQICGIFKVPPHRIGIFEKNTNYNNTEQGNKAFLDGTMQQWVVRWEQAMNWKLLTEGERRSGLFFKFNFDALLRPDAKTRSEMAWREWQMGTPLNEIRKRNDENPVEGGDISFVPVNMIPAELAGQQSEAKTELQENDIESVRKFERTAVERLVKREIAGNCNDFNGKLDEIYSRINRMLTDKTSLILRCFNDQVSTNNIIAKYKDEFNSKKQKINELRKRNFENIEDVWS